MVVYNKHTNRCKQSMSDGEGERQMIGIINIHSRSEDWIARELSNFAAHEFQLDGYRIACFEGFLQSMKFGEPEMQRKILDMSGKEAKQAGSGQDWEQTGWLYWNGRGYRRYSREYRLLLERAYDALLENEGFRNALIASRGKLLIHTIGRYRHTILTVPEFCGILMKKRRKLLREMRKAKGGTR